MFRTNVNEMNIQPVDLGDELWQSQELRFHLPPIVVSRPIARERLHRRELYALRCIGNRLSFGPLGRVDAPAQLGQFRFGNAEVKRADGSLVRCLLAMLLDNTGTGHVSSSASRHFVT